MANVCVPEGAVDHIDLRIVTTSLPPAGVGEDYQATLQAEYRSTRGDAVPGFSDALGRAGWLNWTIFSGSLPEGLRLIPSSGTIWGTPVEPGISTFGVKVTDSLEPPKTSAVAVFIEVHSSLLTITTTALPPVTQGDAYSQTLQATGGVPPYSWSITAGTLPDGLSLGSVCELADGTVIVNLPPGTICGTPTTAGTFDFTVQATDSAATPQTDTQDLSIHVSGILLTITTTALPDAIEGDAYSQTLQATGGITPYTWSEPTGLLGVSGTACEGLALDADGNLTGTPVTSGTCGPFTAMVTDSANPPQTDTQELSIIVNPAGPLLPPGVVGRISVSSDGTQGNEMSMAASISGDGRYVAFASLASNLVSGDTNNAQDVFVADTCQGAPAGCTPTTVRVSVASDGTEGNGFSGAPSISRDGVYVTFFSGASNLVAGDTNNAPDIFIHNRDADQDGILDEPGAIATLRVSVASDGTQANAGVFGATSISDTGRCIAFASSASNLVSGDTNGVEDVFVHDRETGQTARVSVANDGSEAIPPPFVTILPVGFAISGDCRFVAFESIAANLVPGDTNNVSDVFVRDTCAGAVGCTPSTVRVSVKSDGSQTTDVWDSVGPTISATGRCIAYASAASDFVAGDTNAQYDVFLHDRDADQDGILDEPGAIATQRVSVASDSTQANGLSFGPAISSDCRLIAFHSVATNLVDVDANAWSDVFLHNLQSGETILLSVADGTQGNHNSWEVSISGLGGFVVFQSDASNLVVNDTNNRTDIFQARTGQ